jgi:hypothetical protein
VRDGIDRFVDRREPIAADLRLGPERSVVRRGRRRQEQPLLFGLKVLEDREAVKRGIGDLDAVADEQLTNLCEPDAIAEPALDRRALLKTARPAVTARPTARGCSASRTWRTSSSLIAACTRTPAVAAAPR